MRVANFVYVIGADDGPQKVGISSDPERRRRDLQGANGIRLHVRYVHEHPRAPAIERAVHRRLSHARTSGEWFAVSADEAREAILAEAESLRPVEQKVYERRSFAIQSPLRGLPRERLIYLLGCVHAYAAAWYDAKGEVVLPPELEVEIMDALEAEGVGLYRSPPGPRRDVEPWPLPEASTLKPDRKAR